MENSNRNNEDLFSKRVRAGRRRTYFIDVRTTRSSDYYVTITESKKKFDEDGYERHKIHLYKEKTIRTNPARRKANLQTKNRIVAIVWIQVLNLIRV